MNPIVSHPMPQGSTCVHAICIHPKMGEHTKDLYCNVMLLFVYADHVESKPLVSVWTLCGVPLKYKP